MRKARPTDDFRTRVQERLTLGLLRRLAARHLSAGSDQLAIFAHDHIGQQVSALGRYERDLLAAVDELLSQSEIGTGCVVDVGANIGNHATWFARRFELVHAFEPNPRTYRLLEFNAQEYPNLYCHNLALSQDARQFRMTSEMSNQGSARLIGLDAGSSGPQVESVSLDAWARSFDLKVALLKVDVEGHELEVFQGARETLVRDRPMLLFEQSRLDANVFCLLEEVGYESFGYFDTEIRRLNGLGLSGSIRGLVRVLLGETIVARTVSKWRELPDRFHSMVIALP